MRLTVNGNVAQYLGMEKGQHVFRAQTALSQRIVFDLLLTQSEVGQKTCFTLQLGTQSSREDLRPAGSGQRVTWVTTSSTLSAGKHELRLLEPPGKTPWSLIELEITEPKRERREHSTPTESRWARYIPSLALVITVAMMLLWLLNTLTP